MFLYQKVLNHFYFINFIFYFYKIYIKIINIDSYLI